MRVWIGWVVYENGKLGDLEFLELVFPACLMLGSIAAGTVYDALFAQPWAATAAAFVKWLRVSAELHQCFREPDMHITNLKCWAFEVARDLPPLCLSVLTGCQLHQQCHINSRIVDALCRPCCWL